MSRKRGSYLLLSSLLLVLVVSCFGVGDVAFGIEYGQLRGNYPMDAPADNYTVLVLPVGWENDPLSRDLRKGFGSDPQLKALRQRTEFVQYRADDPNFQHSFARLMPAAASGQPTVLVVQGEEKLLCKYGDSAKEVSKAVKCGKLMDKLNRFRPNQPGPGPGPGPNPNCPNCPNQTPNQTYPSQVPVIPEILETPDEDEEDEEEEEDEEAKEEDANMTVVLGTLLAGAACVWLVSARARM